MTINKGSQYFNTATWTGVGSNTSITGVGFQPDLVWVKDRTSGTPRYHNLYDSVRGPTKSLITNTTDQQDTRTTGLLSFDSDGFSIGTDLNLNDSGNTYVGWCWSGGDSTETNNDGTIESQVRANPTSGFSVVTYTGTGSGGATVGHGLGAAPGFIIVKVTSTTGGWFVWQKSMSNQAKIDLSSADALYDPSNGLYLNSTTPDANVVTLGTSSYVNGSSSNYVMYAWAEIEGFSKFGSYTGTGVNPGPFIYTGFRPAFLLGRRSDANGNNWYLYDSARDTYNPCAKNQTPNAYGGDGNSAAVDFLSNGFKLRTTGGMNDTGNIIYMAFAENPFKVANAR